MVTNTTARIIITVITAQITLTIIIIPITTDGILILRFTWDTIGEVSITRITGIHSTFGLIILIIIIPMDIIILRTTIRIIPTTADITTVVM